MTSRLLPLNPRRRYSWHSMHLERERAAKRLSKQLHVLSVADLHRAERILVRAEKAVANFLAKRPRLDPEDTSAPHKTRVALRRLEAKAFYATVERDALRSVLHHIEPLAVPLVPPTPEQMLAEKRTPQESAKLSVAKYHFPRVSKRVADLTDAHTVLREEVRRLRAEVQAAADATHVATTEHERRLTEALTAGRTRAPRGSRGVVVTARARWREAYAQWEARHAELRRLRARLDRARETQARYEETLLTLGRRRP